MGKLLKDVAALLVGVVIFGSAVVAVASHVQAMEKPALPVKVDEETALKVENLGLKVQIVRQQIQALQQEGQRLQAEQAAVAKAAAEKVGLDWNEVNLDLGTKQFVAKPPPGKK